eukprot:2963612-Rhodomonas_salina.2
MLTSLPPSLLALASSLLSSLSLWQILACLQHHHPITDSDAGFVPTFVCMEGKDGLPKDEFKDCADANGLDTAAQETILACAAGDEGQKLALEVRVRMLLRFARRCCDADADADDVEMLMLVCVNV